MKIKFIFATFAILAAGCGMENPYAKHEKKCKTNCGAQDGTPDDSPRNHPRATTTQPTDASYWMNIFDSSNVTPIIDASVANDASFMAIVRANPFTATKTISGIGAVLSRFRADIDFAKQMASSTTGTTPEDVRTCIKNAFSTPWIPNQGTVVDFGKCIPLNHEMFTSNAQTSNGGIIAYTEYEKTVSFKSKNDWPQLATAFDLRNIAPFTVPDAVATSLALEFNLNTLILQAAKEIQQKKVVSAVREWSFISLGESIDKPFKVEFDSTIKRMTINGDMLIAQQSAYNPPSSNVFTGQQVEGNKIQISFQDFTITGADVLPDTQLGFRNTASLGGSYLVAVNYSETKANHRNYFIQVKGKGIPCVTDAYVIMLDADGNPVTTDDPFQIDLCALER